MVGAWRFARREFILTQETFACDAGDGGQRNRILSRTPAPAWITAQANPLAAVPWKQPADKPNAGSNDRACFGASAATKPCYIMSGNVLAQQTMAPPFPSYLLQPCKKLRCAPSFTDLPGRRAERPSFPNAPGHPGIRPSANSPVSIPRLRSRPAGFCA
jgi:hypothetical protein